MLSGPDLKRWLKRLALGLASVLLAAVLWWAGLRVFPPPDPYAARPAGVRVLDREGRLVRGFLSPDEKWRWRLDLAEINPTLVTAVLHHEDRNFFRHHGVDPGAVVRAAWGNLRARRVTSGASTITMQLARLVEPRPRTWSAKLHQALRALQYESLYSKDRILEMYLNLAPYGGNVEGVGPAARVFFDKPAAELSWAEACLLAVLPQSPGRHDPVEHPAIARGARDDLAHRLAAAGTLDRAILDELLSRPVPRSRHPMPFAAPHFSRWSRNRHPEQHNLITTLDLDLQARVRKLVRAHARRLAPRGIDQMAAVVMDVANGEIRAMVGSVDFRDAARQGQVNGAVAPRSPGSTLKPLVFALAFDRGLTTPDALLEDVPRHFGDYSPENFDGRFAGAVRCGTALQRSLNVPAVSLAADLELAAGGGLHRFLREAGVTTLDQEATHYGLSLVLGGGEVNLLELASLYGLLGRHGLWLPIRDVPDQPGTDPRAGRSLLGAGACWLTLQELRGLERPEPERVWRNRLGGHPIAWKTGTSYGHRDAWSVGLVGDQVLAVWVGNFAGRGSPLLTGARAAAPLFFDLAAALDGTGEAAWQQRPPQVQTRQVCALSGAPCTEACPSTIAAPYLPGISPAAPCAIHRLIQVDDATGLSLCSRCRGDRSWHSLVVEWWPPQVASYLAGGHLETQVIPPHEPGCPAWGRGDAPQITSPQDGREYILRPGVPSRDQALALTANVGSGVNKVYWFINGELVAQGDPARTRFLEPEPGRTTVAVVDDAGRSHTINIQVKSMGGS